MLSVHRDCGGGGTRRSNRRRLRRTTPSDRRTASPRSCSPGQSSGRRTRCTCCTTCSGTKRRRTKSATSPTGTGRRDAEATAGAGRTAGRRTRPTGGSAAGDATDHRLPPDDSTDAQREGQKERKTWQRTRVGQEAVDGADHGGAPQRARTSSPGPEERTEQQREGETTTQRRTTDEGRGRRKRRTGSTLWGWRDCWLPTAGRRGRR